MKLIDQNVNHYEQSHTKKKHTFSNAIRKIKLHDFLKFRKENRSIHRKTVLKKKIMFLHNLQDEDNIECPICMEPIEKGNRSVTYCGHFFCFSCIKKQ